MARAWKEQQTESKASLVGSIRALAQSTEIFLGEKSHENIWPSRHSAIWEILHDKICQFFLQNGVSNDFWSKSQQKFVDFDVNRARLTKPSWTSTQIFNLDQKNSTNNCNCPEISQND